MKIITWNIHRAKKDSGVWNFLINNQPDIVLLQEVGGIPANISENYDILSRNAITKYGNPQRFSTTVLVKGKIVKEINLKSEFDWVNNEIEYFQGNVVGCVAQLSNNEIIHAISAYSPAWPVDEKRLVGVDTSAVKLKTNPKVWVTELIWSGLRNTMKMGETWVVGGDLNSSETFDKEYQKKHNLTGGMVNEGNKEIRERMYALGLKECLREYNGKLVPTYKHTNGEIIHQLDHLYVSSDLYPRLTKCFTGDRNKIFGEFLSDHLSILGYYKDEED